MKNIILYGSWQTKNIGDIAHTPGFLSLAKEFLPEEEYSITLWPCALDRGVREMLLKNFPSLRIVEEEEEVKKAFAQCDLFIHGSCPYPNAGGVNYFRQHSSKPYGFYGISADGFWSEERRELLDNASFIFCRDSISEHFLHQQSLRCPRIAFTPDSTFALRLEPESNAEDFMRENGLEEGKFLCVIPRLRWTPTSFDEENFYYKDEKREQATLQRLEEDMAKMRSLICSVVEKSDLKVLICPEMTYQVPLGRRYLYDRLPEKIRSRVVLKREYWITDEAQSLYSKAHSLLSMEMHSPIIFITQGKPAILLRQAEDTVKGQMWRDVGLQKWIFELNVTSPEEVEKSLLEIIEEYPAALQCAEKARSYAWEVAEERFAFIRELLKK